MQKAIVSPSLICANINNVENQINELMRFGIDLIHVDLIDGKFSPDIPMSFEQFEKIAATIDFPMDFHIMSVDNEAYIKKVLKYNAKQICFHCEYSIHTDRMLNIIKNANVKCGVALAPATPISVLEYAVEICDFVLLMLINPGYASFGGEKMVPYAYRKIADCRNFLERHNRDIPIEVDGRVSVDCMPDLIACGADILVSGSTGVFMKGNSLKENYEKIQKAVKQGIVMRKENDTCIRNAKI